MARINAPQYGIKGDQRMSYARQHYNLAVTGKATQNCEPKTSSGSAKPAPKAASRPAGKRK